MASQKRWGSGARVDDLDKGKQLLLKAAIECFVSKGIKATTVEDVAAAANVTRRTVYRYYAGKREIVAAVIDLERQRMFRKLRVVLEPFSNDLPRLLEECIIFTASYFPPEEGKSDLVTGANAKEAFPHLAAPASDEAWFDVLAKPYQNYVQQHGAIAPLQELVAVLGRMVLSYREIPASPEQIRRDLRALRLTPLAADGQSQAANQ